MKFLKNLKNSGHFDRRFQKEFRTARITSHDPGKRCLSVACMARNEGRYLREWIEFHRLVGVEHFTFYDNGSNDNTAAVLAPYVRSGLVEVIPWPHFLPDCDTQALAYAHALSHAGPSTRWLAFIDLDEYLFAPSGKPLPEVLSDYEDLPALVVYWVMFGTSGHEEPVSGLRIEHFTRRAPIPSGPVKDPILAKYKSIVQPKFVSRIRGVHDFVVNADGSVGFDENRNRIFKKRPHKVSVQQIRINHYYTGSRSEWLSRFGRVAGPGSVVRDDFLNRAYEAVERCPVEDREILKYLPQLKRALGEQTD